MQNNKGTASVLYVTYIDFDKALSGSSVRPQNMYRAFLQCGYDVKLLKGQQNKRKQRRANVREVLEWLDANRPDICYVEPPTGPFFNSIDHRLLKKVHKMGIPIGLFYRDAYWRYNLIDYGKGLLPALKAWVIKAMQKRDYRLFKEYCDIVYITSQLAAEEWDFKKINLLPPGCNLPENIETADRKPGVCAIYVGGVNKRYGTFAMLDAFKLINSEGTKVPLKLICRQAEWDSCGDYRALAQTDWLDVMHIEGEALAQQYLTCDLALCPLEKDFYNDMAMPIKLLEYMSYGKPVVVTECVEMRNFVNKYQTGIVTAYNAEDIAGGVLRMAQDDALRQRLTQNCLAAREQNTWAKRAEQVVSDLTSLKH